MAQEDRICLFKWLVVSFVILYTIVSVSVAIFTLYLRFEFFSSSFMQVDDHLQSNYYIAISILIAGSVLATVAGIIGLFGAFLRKTVVLFICLALVIIFLLVQICGGCYGYYYRYTIHQDLRNGVFLKNLVISDYGYNTAKTKAMDYMQWQLECCGGESMFDYQHSGWYATKKQEYQDFVVPPSCCSSYERHRDLRQYPCLIYLSDTYGPRNNINNLNPKIHKMGCGPTILTFIEHYYIPLIALATSFVIYQIIVVVLISMLIHFLRQRNTEDEGFEMSRSFEKGGSPYW